MEFPDYYPSQCPPTDSIDASGTFYRAIKGDKPVQDDFLSHWIRNPERQRKWTDKGKACEFCGLSVNANIDDLKRKQEKIPALRGKIAKGTLIPKMGKIKSTPRESDLSHHTWWIPNGVEDIPVSFKVVA